MKLNPKILLLFIFLFSLEISAQEKYSFEIKDENFLYDAKPIQIHSREVHNALIPKEYWRNRLRKLYAMGLNTVATYVFWKFHNTAPAAN